MAKFYFKYPKHRFIIQADSVLTIEVGGVPTIIRKPCKKVEIKGGFLDTAKEKERWAREWEMKPEEAEKLVVDKIRRNRKFNTSSIKEFTPEDERAVTIKNRKLKEAQEEIDKLTKEKDTIIPKTEDRRPIVK